MCDVLIRRGEGRCRWPAQVTRTVRVDPDDGGPAYNRHAQLCHLHERVLDSQGFVPTIYAGTSGGQRSPYSKA